MPKATLRPRRVRNDTKPALQIRPDVRDGETDSARVFTVGGGQTAFHEYMDSAAAAKAFR
jgi:hypothetical protein